MDWLSWVFVNPPSGAKGYAQMTPLQLKRPRPPAVLTCCSCSWSRAPNISIKDSFLVSPSCYWGFPASELGHFWWHRVYRFEEMFFSESCITIGGTVGVFCVAFFNKVCFFKFSPKCDISNTLVYLSLPSNMVTFFRARECSQSFRRRSSVIVLRMSISFLSWASVWTWVTHRLLVSSVMLLIWIWTTLRTLTAG